MLICAATVCAAEYQTDGNTITVTGVPSECRLIIASYSPEGALTGCDLYAPENGVISGVPDTVTNGGSVKMFLWNMTNLSPVEMSEAPSPSPEPSDAPTTEPAGGGTLVAYFSWTNNTEGVANHIADITGADKFEIVPKIPYGPENSNYYDPSTRSYQEQYDDTARPEIEGGIQNIDKYDIVFLGYPIWYGKAPKIIYTFLESYNFEGKTIIPFCTSGSSGIGSTAELQNLTRGANWLDGRRFAAGASKDSVAEWIDSLKLDFGSDEEVSKMRVQIGDAVFTATLEDNAAVGEFVEMMREAPVTINMSDYSGFEKVGSLGLSLTTGDVHMTTSPGDIVLYSGNQIVMFYAPNSWSYTKIGHIDDLTGWEDALGSGDITAVFSIAE